MVAVFSAATVSSWPHCRDAVLLAAAVASWPCCSDGVLLAALWQRCDVQVPCSPYFQGMAGPARALPSFAAWRVR